MALVIERQREKAKEDALEAILRTRVAGNKLAEPLLKYWQAVDKRGEEIEEPGQAKALVDQLRKDVDSLRDLRMALRGHRNDPQAAVSEPQLTQILRVLEAILDQLERRWWALRNRAWAQWNILNPAMPKRHQDHDKDKRKMREAPGLEQGDKKGGEEHA